MSRHFRRVAVALLLAAVARSAIAAPRQLSMVDFVQDVWDAAADGLPHPGVTAIRQTRDGYLWVATFGGVVRFDGIQFKPPDVADARARVALADHVRCFVEASDGTMWFGTRREGLVRLRGREGQVFTPKEGLAATDVRAIAEAQDGGIWIATTGGVSLWDGSRFRNFGTEDGLPSRNALAVLADSDGSIWVGTQSFGVARYNGTRFDAVPLQFLRGISIIEEASGIGLTSVGALARDTDGVLWSGTSVGLVRIGEGGEESKHLVPGAFNGLGTSRDGGLWVSSGAGLGRYQNGRWRRYTIDDGLLTDGVHVVFEDAEGSIWVGTRIGLARLRPRFIRTYTRRDGLAHETVTSVIETKDGVWAGTRNGASRFSGGRWTTISAAQGLPHDSVRAFAEGPDGSLWIGTLDGLARYKDGRITTYRGQEKPYSVRGLAFDSQGTLWIATQSLDRLEGNVVRTVMRLQDLCDRSAVNYLYGSRDGALWMGTAAALVRIEDGRSDCLKDNEVLSRNDVRSVYEDAAGALWVGSIGGLSRIVNGKRENLVATDGPFATAIYGLLDDGQRGYWFSTPRGLFRVDKARVLGESSTTLADRAFGTADGMDSPVGTGGGVPTAWRGRDGRLWFATATGVAVVDPSRLEADAYIPPVYIERLVADHRPVDVKGQPRLPAGTRDVELHFALLSFTAPERAHYKYQLEGHDNGWVDSGSRRVAYYSNLEPRRHRFRVLAANHNGIWNETGATLEFEIAPRFYETRWFAPLAILLVVSASVGLYRMRIAALRSRQEELQRSVDEALANVQVLSGLLPICASCRRVREDTGYWRQIEAYVQERSSAKFSHGVCPDCWEKMREEEPGLPEYQGGK